MSEADSVDSMIYDGLVRTVEYAVCKNGKMEAKQWLESQSLQIQAGFDVLFRRYGDTGRISNKQHFRQLADQIWEFKRKEHRMLCAMYGRRLLLTHRIKKAGGSGKCPAAEIARANFIFDEHVRRESKLRTENKKKDDK